MTLGKRIKQASVPHGFVPQLSEVIPASCLPQTLLSSYLPHWVSAIPQILHVSADSVLKQMYDCLLSASQEKWVPVSYKVEWHSFCDL